MEPQIFSDTDAAPADTAAADAAPAAAAPSLPVVRVAPPIVVLSEDAMLLGAVMTAALDQATVVVCASTDRFVDQLVATTPELAVVDAAATGDLPTLLDSLRHQFPQMQLLVAGPGNVQHLIARQLGDGTVFRFAHKPTSAARLKLFVDAALRERQTRITAEILNAPLDAPAMLDFVVPGHTVVYATGALRRMALRRAPFAALGLVAVIGCYGYLHQSTSPHSPVVATIERSGPADDASADTERTADVPPPVSRELEAAAEQAAIDQASMARSQRSEQERLAAELAAASAARAASRSAAAAQARRDDNDSLLQGLQHDTEARMVATDVQPPTVSLSASLPAMPATPATPAMPSTPSVTFDDGAKNATVRPVTATNAIMDESRLHRIEFVAPHYPLDALRNGVGGEVEMDFTLTPTGEVTDARVTSASPYGIFEASSIEALSRNRYEPVLRDGVAVTQQAHIRMRYEP
jgi:TonB family protein